MQTPPARQSVRRYAAIPLSRLVKPGARGAPPAEWLKSGVCGMSPGDMAHARVHLGQPLLLTAQQDDGKEARAVVRAWPVASVHDGKLALDPESLATLGPGASAPENCAPCGSRERDAEDGKDRNGGIESPRTPRKGGGRSGRTPRRKEARRRESRGREGTVAVEALEEESGDVDEATKVRFQIATLEARGSDGGQDRIEQQQRFLEEEEVALHVRSSVAGRFVTVGSTCCVSVLGRPLRLEVVELGSVLSARVVLIRIETKVEFADLDERWSDDPVDGVTRGVRRMNVDAGHVRPGFEEIGGLSSQVKTVLELAQAAFDGVRSISRSDSDGRLSEQRQWRKRPRGVLLHGPPGCGKTLVARAVAGTCGARLFTLSGPDVVGALAGESEASVTALFRRAYRQRPAVIVLDEVDAIAPRRDGPKSGSAERRLTAALLTLLDGGDFRYQKDVRGGNDDAIEGEADGVFIVATTNIPDAIDPAMRRAGRLGWEIEIPVPNAAGRFDILHRLTAKSRDSGRLAVPEEALREIARVAHGLVGADLAAVWRECVSSALRRAARTAADGGKLSQSSGSIVESCDFDAALSAVKPSALREVEVEIPTVRWTDIGGMKDAKARLREAIELPLSVAGSKLLRSIGVSAPRGLLLFGPPGCSKTLLAKAVATETGANFISVKGPELLSKWVGESEKAVQSTFRRARLSAPCVVFFDEIDALAHSRGAGGSAQSRVVAQLLTEMDGIGRADELLEASGKTTDAENAEAWLQSSGRGRVVVVAATNRPDLLDPALLRPGRLGLQVYVGLPNAEERAAILRVHASRVPVEKSFDVGGLAVDGGSTEGMSGAELASLVREAALAAMEEDVEGATVVTARHFEIACSRVRPRTPSDVLAYFERYRLSTRNVV